MSNLRALGTPSATPSPARPALVRRRPSSRRAAALLIAWTANAAALGPAAAPAAAPAASTPAPRRLPEGPPIASTLARPAQERYPLRACSFTRALCVHARHGAAPGAVLATLRELEAASAVLTGALALPPPLDDGALGGDGAFDVYLVPPDALPAPAIWGATGRDAPQLGTRDQASAFTLLRDDLHEGCARAHALTNGLVAAILWGQDAGDTATARESTSAYLAELTAPCAVVTSELIDDFQAHPERGVTAPSATLGGAVALALPWYLDAALGSGVPGVLPIAIAALGGQRSPVEGWTFRNEPDQLDVLRRVLESRGESGLPDLWMDFAIARLFMGARDDGARFPESAFTSNEGRVRFDWELPYASLPRRVSHVLPLEPTGATYTWIDTVQAEPGAQLAFRFEWEAPVPFRWALVRVRRDGGEDSRVLVTAEQKSTSADKLLDDVSGLAGVVVVGVNVGDVRASDPFDPDEAPYEPHGFVMSVMRVGPAGAAPSPSAH